MIGLPREAVPRTRIGPRATRTHCLVSDEKRAEVTVSGYFGLLN